MSSTYVLRGANVLDESGGFESPLDVVVVNGNVSQIGRNVAAPDDATEHDFGGLWVLPGIFDCHDHVASSTTNEIEGLRTPLPQWVLETAQNLRNTLECGVTFVRDAAGADPGMRESVARGYVPGPRLQVCLNILSETGGHGDGFLQGLGVESVIGPDWPGKPPTVIDGVEEMRRVVRQLIRAGVDWIKLCSTGGIMSPHDEGDEPQFTEEEIRVAVVEAARKGRFVMSHAFGGEGLSNAVRAGVKSIEHGLLMDEKEAAEMAKAGTWLVPTLSIAAEVVRWAEAAVASGDTTIPEYSIRKALAIKPRLGKQVALAKEAGVRMALGTDWISRDQHGRNLEELPLMHQAGLTVEETLLAATAWGAELCGVADRYGRIAPGFVFDAIVLDQDPGDLSLFNERGSVTGVFKGGVPAVAHPRLGARELVEA